MAEKEATAGNGKKTRVRSPQFPFIKLEDALKRARKLYDEEKRHAAALATVADHFGSTVKSSGFLQTIAALKQYKLVDDEEAGAARKVKVSSLAIRILLDQREDGREREKAIKEAALSPKLFREFWSKWGVQQPSANTFRTELTIERDFNEGAADDFIKVYRDTIAFAKLAESDSEIDSNKDRGGGDGDNKAIQVGDYVQWESNGVLQFTEPRKVIQVSPDEGFVHVEGSNTGIPMDQVSKQQPPAATPPHIPLPPAGRGMSFTWTLSVPRAVHAELRIHGTEIRKADVARLRKQLDFLEESFEEDE